MIKKFSRLHVLGAVAVLGATVSLAVFLSPAFLRASLVADGGQCYQHTSGDYLYDTNLSDMSGWSVTDSTNCSNMGKGDIKQNGAVIVWGKWSRTAYGGTDSSGSGGSSTTSGTNSTAATSYTCYQDSNTGDITVLSGPAATNSWFEIPFNKCDGLQPGETKNDGTYTPANNSTGTSTTTSGNSNWVNHTWYFSDGTSQDSFILSRTDSEYLNYISGMDKACKSSASVGYNSPDGWMPDAGNDSNWKNFGIPNCKGTAATTVTNNTATNNTATNNTATNNNSSTNVQNTTNSWVQHFWKFADSKKMESSILNRTDADYLAYISKVDQACSLVKSNEFSWMPDAGNDSNWKNFGIPNCLEKAGIAGINSASTDKDDHKYDSDKKDENQNRDRELKDMKHEIKRAEKDLKNIKRECKKNSCVGVDKTLSVLEGIHAQMVKAHADKEFVEFWDLIQDFNFAQQDFWDGFQDVQQADDLKRWVRDVEREIKDRTRWIKDLKRQKSDVSGMEKILLKMNKLLDDAQAAMADGDFDDARDIFEFDFTDLRYEFEDVGHEAEKEREGKFFKEDMKRTLDQIEGAAKMLEKLLASGKIKATDASACREHIVKGKTLAKAVLEALEDDDFEDADELRFDLQDVGDEAMRVCPGLDVYRPDFDSFNDVYLDDNNQKMSKDVLEKLSNDIVNKVMNRIQSNPAIFNDLIENGGSKFSSQISQMLENTSYIKDDTKHGELMSRKATLLAQVQEMEELTAKLQSLKQIAIAEVNEIEAVKQQIANYNFAGTAGAEIEADVEDFLADLEFGDLTKSEIAEKVRQLKGQATQAIEDARKEKFASNLIPFLDADDSDWFTKYAAFTKNEGWVKGTGESNFSSVNPGAETNVAEAVTMLGRVVGIDSSAVPTSSLASKLPQWAHPGLAALEKVGANPSTVFGNKSGDDVVTRAEVAVLVQRVFALSAGDASGFNDLSGVSTTELSSIGSVNKAGIMTGEGGTTSFNPRGALNRAALMKILTKAAELTSAK